MARLIPTSIVVSGAAHSSDASGNSSASAADAAAPSSDERQAALTSSDASSAARHRAPFVFEPNALQSLTDMFALLGELAVDALSARNLLERLLRQLVDPAADTQASPAAELETTAGNVHVPSFVLLLFALSRFDEAALLTAFEQCVVNTMTSLSAEDFLAAFLFDALRTALVRRARPHRSPVVRAHALHSAPP